MDSVFQHLNTNSQWNFYLDYGNSKPISNSNDSFTKFIKININSKEIHSKLIDFLKLEIQYFKKLPLVKLNFIRMINDLENEFENLKALHLKRMYGYKKNYKNEILSYKIKGLHPHIVLGGLTGAFFLGIAGCYSNVWEDSTVKTFDFGIKGGLIYGFILGGIWGLIWGLYIVFIKK